MESTLKVAEAIAENERQLDELTQLERQQVQDGVEDTPFEKIVEKRAKLETEREALRRRAHAAENAAEAASRAEARKRAVGFRKTVDTAQGDFGTIVEAMQVALAEAIEAAAELDAIRDRHDTALAAVKRITEQLGDDRPAIARLPRLKSLVQIREAVAAWERDLERGGLR